MEDIIRFLALLAPTSLMPVAVLLLVLGGGAVAWPLVVAKGDRNEVKRRLKVEVVQPIEQAEMMAVQMKHGGDVGAVGQGHHHRTAQPGPKGGRRRCREAHRRHPLGRRSAERQVSTNRVLEIELRRQAVGR